MIGFDVRQALTFPSPILGYSPQMLADAFGSQSTRAASACAAVGRRILGYFAIRQGGTFSPASGRPMLGQVGLKGGEKCREFLAIWLIERHQRPMGTVDDLHASHLS